MKNILYFGILISILTLSGCQKTCTNEVQLLDLDENPVCLDDYKGKRVLLNLWATWCRPCVMEMPSIHQAYQTLKSEGYIFLAASNEPIPLIANFESQNNYDFPLVKISDNFEPFNISAIPTTIIYDSEGNIAFQKVGAYNWNSPEMLEQLRAVK